MALAAIIISIISIIVSGFSIYANWQFAKNQKHTDDTIIEVDKKVETNLQLLQKAIKKDYLDKDNNLKKKYNLE